ncbi:methylmalonyl-CoA mutase, C-terminal domain [Salinibacillus kushneri]|uniref:Methylmalonyl-CoA mutase, C-terminal domain n=1 Tax=Salinibacillus kushneri TaxID=237682 RepID=A0A1I0FMN3_9BACI|nr:methylmalonyl-CoA epimerase [Salinibacillus kushneri]SET59329.1 methylmalonyl-CoA mutase, C-terminal domain [Salinibacillus kushneri]
MGKKIRALIAKPGLDGHDRGALIIAQTLRDHGMEVIYTGLRQSPAQIAQAAVQEDVDVIGLSSLSGAHRSLFPKVVEQLKERQAEDIPVIGGGVIPAEDIPFLEEKGVQKVFTPGTPTEYIAAYIKQLVTPEEVKETTPPEKISHIGIAVKSLEKTIPFYDQILGLNLKGVEEVPSEGVKVAFFEIGETSIELLEPLSEQSPIYKFVEKKGEGIHHIALEVSDLKDRLQHYRDQDVPLINEEPKEGANGAEIAFLHPRAANGVLYELCHHRKGES